jgi:hypothetical protein
MGSGLFIKARYEKIAGEEGPYALLAFEGERITSNCISSPC